MTKRTAKKSAKKSSGAVRLMFAYGANTNVASMQYRCPAAVSLGAAEVDGFVLEFRVHADIVEREGATVGGVLWSVTPECERALDSFEGFPTYYVKRTVRVRWNGRTVRAFAYVMAPTVERGRVAPSSHYVKTLRAGYRTHRVETTQIDVALGRALAAESIADVQRTGDLEQLWLDLRSAS